MDVFAGLKKQRCAKEVWKMINGERNEKKKHQECYEHFREVWGFECDAHGRQQEVLSTNWEIISNFQDWASTPV